MLNTGTVCYYVIRIYGLFVCHFYSTPDTANVFYMPCMSNDQTIGFILAHKIFSTEDNIFVQLNMVAMMRLNAPSATFFYYWFAKHKRVLNDI